MHLQAPSLQSPNHRSPHDNVQDAASPRLHLRLGLRQLPRAGGWLVNSTHAGATTCPEESRTQPSVASGRLLVWCA
jgi:hypothetical protein